MRRVCKALSTLHLSENELAFGHGGDRDEKVLESNDFFCTHDIIANVQTLNLALFECICQHLDVIHNDQVVTDI